MGNNGVHSKVSGQAYLGQLCMSLVEKLEEDYGDNFDINMATIIADVEFNTPDGNRGSVINFRSTEKRHWIQKALFLRCAHICDKASSRS